MTNPSSQTNPPTHQELDERCAIVLAGVQRLGGLQGFPVTDFSLVAETDLDLAEVRECLSGVLAGTHVEAGPGEVEGSVQVNGLPGHLDETTPDVPSPE